MFWSAILGLLVLLLRDVVAASSVFRDPETGLTFASDEKIYMNDKPGIIYRFAIPGNVSPPATYDTVIQIVAPREVGWAGVAFGGGMQASPLFVAYRATGGQYAVTGSMRWSPGHVDPVPYTGATYTVLKTGTKANNTHWQITAKCTGCTSWYPSSSSPAKYLVPNGSNHVAMAMSLKMPPNPNSNTSTIDYHYMHGYWDADFRIATNGNLTAALQKLHAVEETS